MYEPNDVFDQSDNLGRGLDLIIDLWFWFILFRHNIFEKMILRVLIESNPRNKRDSNGVFDPPFKPWLFRFLWFLMCLSEQKYGCFKQAPCGKWRKLIGFEYSWSKKHINICDKSTYVCRVFIHCNKVYIYAFKWKLLCHLFIHNCKTNSINSIKMKIKQMLN